MRLHELEAQFVVRTDKGWRRVESLAEAAGLDMLCPKCFRENGNSAVGTHHFLLWRPRVPHEFWPTAARWEFIGTGLSDLTLVAGSSSVLAKSGCKAHFFVRNGAIELLPA